MYTFTGYLVITLTFVLILTTIIFLIKVLIRVNKCAKIIIIKKYGSEIENTK